MNKILLIVLIIISAGSVLFPAVMYNRVLKFIVPGPYNIQSFGKIKTKNKGNLVIIWMIRLFFLAFLILIIYGIHLNGWPS